MTEDVIEYWEKNADRYRDEAYRYDPARARYPFYETRLALLDDMAKALPLGRCLDAGCGGGAVTIHFLEKGWDGYGVDAAEAMVALARQNLTEAGHSAERIGRTSVTDLELFPDEHFDLIISAGVMEYLTEEEEAAAFAEARRVLRPDGRILVENINGLFDLSTFNRFTIDFFAGQVFPLFFEAEAERAELAERLRGLVAHPDKPSREGVYSTTRDQVYTKSEIPLDYGRKVAGYGFKELEQGFYRFHAVPPLLFEDRPELERVAIAKELELSRHWIGTFMASGFISLLAKS